MVVYLCRHAARGANGCERTAPVHLTEAGFRQADRLADFLAPKHPQAILSSPKVRSIETAQALSLLTYLPICVWPCLIEYDAFGPRDYSDEALEAAGGVLDESKLLGGTPVVEDVKWAYKRAQAALTAIRGARLDRVAVFAHEEFNRLFIRAWQGRRDPYITVASDRLFQPEACVNVLEDGMEPVIGMRVV